MTAPTGWWCPNCGHTASAHGATPDLTALVDAAHNRSIEAALNDSEQDGWTVDDDRKLRYCGLVVADLELLLNAAFNTAEESADAGAAPYLTAPQQAVIDAAESWADADINGADYAAVLATLYYAVVDYRAALVRSAQNDTDGGTDDD